jgi:MoxR-like ATPase
VSKGAIVTVAAGAPLLGVLELCWAARRPVLLKGGTGVGKSTILAEFARKKKIGFICRDLSLMEPPDLVGMPKLVGGRTRFFPPTFLPKDGKGLLVLEEINRAADYMRAPCLMLLTDRTLNDYHLPDGWLPMAAINPAEDGYDAAELDPAVLTRFVQINVVADRDPWLDWARQNGVHGDVIAYVQSDPGVFDSPFSNPRSWVHVSDLLHAQRGLRTDKALLRAAVAGCVGAERAAAFFGFLTNGVQPLKAADVLSAYPSHRDELRGWVADGKLDVVEATLLNVQKRLQAATDFQAVRDDAPAWKHLGRFLADLPGDLRERAREFLRDHDYELPRAGRRA